MKKIKKRRFLKKVKNFTLKAITALALIAFSIGGCSFDNNVPLSIVLCTVSIAWLAIFTYVNDWWEV